jgi:drug/metabolite transporter (DMT)-like permease
MFPTNLAGVLFGVLSALVWGSADFSGGLAARRMPPFQVVVLGSFSGALSMGLLAWLRGESLPGPASIAWALAAGVAGALGIAALYRGLASGSASLVAPTAAVVGAALPVLAVALLQGLAGWTQSLGLVLGVLGIWQVSSTTEERPGAVGMQPVGDVSPPAGLKLRQVLRQPGLLPAILAGIAFSGFFLCLAQSGNQAGSLDAGMRPIFFPLMIAKLASLLTGILIVRLQGQPMPALHARPPTPLALLSGVLDAGGNLFFLLAQQYTRLDIAVIVSSMYPVSTVVLSALVLKQKATRQQGLGLVLCLLALALIAV